MGTLQFMKIQAFCVYHIHINCINFLQGNCLLHKDKEMGIFKAAVHLFH